MESVRRVASLARRQLSFVDCSVEQVRSALSEEDPERRLHLPCWESVVCGNPSPSFKTLQSRSLAFWVKCFNKWREIGQGKPIGQDMVNGNQLQDMLFISRANLLQVCELFDAEGAVSLRIGGLSHNNLARARISPCELMLAGVLLSKRIATPQKLRFVLGLFDTEDCGFLTEAQFGAFVAAFHRGPCAAFAAAESVPPPSAREAQGVAKQLFKHISTLSTVQQTAKHGSASVEQRISGVYVYDGKACQCNETGPTLSTATIQDWCCGSSSDMDALALPYRLIIERFSPGRDGFNADAAGCFDGKDDAFEGLTHTGPPVPALEDDRIAHGRDLLSRADVIFARELYRHCIEASHLRLTMYELRALARKHEAVDAAVVPPGFLVRIYRALDALSEERHGVNGPAFCDMLRKMCPKAQARHVRMYEAWCVEYDELASEREVCMHLEFVVAVHAENKRKPCLPNGDIEFLKREFHRLDRFGKGYIDWGDLSSGWDWVSQTAEDTVTAYDTNLDNHIDRDEFVRMMCPQERRLPTMEGGGYELFGRILTHLAERSRASLAAKEARFSRRRGDHVGTLLATTPPMALPKVDEAVWNEWNDAYDSLDVNKDGKVNVMELRCSGLLEPAVCDGVVRWLFPGDSEAVSREIFLAALLRAYGFRRESAKM